MKKHYASDRLSFSLKTKSYASAVRAAQSVTQRLEDYWLGLRLQQMDIPAIHLVKTDDVEYTSPVMLDVSRVQKRFVHMNKIVIVGGGFAGINAAKTLVKSRRRDIEVTLIDKRNHNLFQPLLYQVATAGLSPADIASPLRKVLRPYKNT